MGAVPVELRQQVTLGEREVETSVRPDRIVWYLNPRVQGRVQDDTGIPDPPGDDDELGVNDGDPESVHKEVER